MHTISIMVGDADSLDSIDFLRPPGLKYRVVKGHEGGWDKVSEM